MAAVVDLVPELDALDKVLIPAIDLTTERSGDECEELRANVGGCAGTDAGAAGSSTTASNADDTHAIAAGTALAVMLADGQDSGRGSPRSRQTKHGRCAGCRLALRPLVGLDGRVWLICSRRASCPFPTRVRVLEEEVVRRNCPLVLVRRVRVSW